MFIKSFISFIAAHVLVLFGVSNTPTYVAPTPTIQQKVASKNVASTTSPKTTFATATKKIGVNATTTKTQTKIQTDTKAKPITASPVKEETKVSPPVAAEPSFDFVDINTFARKAVVNILCKTRGTELSPISGTGVIVGPNGLILTNAHIGQYLLLRDFRGKDSVECVARTGSPASPKYNLEIVYISPTWVANNKSILKDTNPKGTGENDFAFLRITSMVDGTPLPDTIPFVPMNIGEDINKGEPVLLVSYPAGFLGGLSILQDLNVTSAITNIEEVYTFKGSTIDLISVPGTVVSQRGSSGGIVADKRATLIGIITTSSEAETTSKRGLNAITVAYINRSLQNELGINLQQFVSQNLSDFANLFQKTTAPTLTKIISDELSK